MNPRQDWTHALNFRHACRSFDRDKTVHQGDLEFILEAGRLAPSSLNLEPWKFIVVRDERLKHALVGACSGQSQVGEASAVIAIVARIVDLAVGSNYVDLMCSRYPIDVQAMMRGYLDEYLRRPDLAQHSMAECLLPAANMMMAAACIGIDSCPVGGFDRAAVTEILGLDPKRLAPVLLLPIGYRTGEPPPRVRLQLGSIVEYR